MANSIFDQLRDAAKRTAQELDDKYALKNKFEQGASRANEAARKAGETVNQAAATARERFGKFDEEHKVTDNLRDAASKAEEAIKQGAEVAQSRAEEFSQATEDTARE